MIPSRYEYYCRRVREHQSLAERAADPAQRGMHEKLIGAYGELADRYRPHEALSLRH